MYGLIIVGAVAAVLATAQYFSRTASQARRRARRIARALASRPRTSIGKAEGPVRVTGHVHGDGDLLTAPLSGRPCVIYELVIDMLASDGVHDYWRRIVHMTKARPFLLTDESGTARVDTSGPFVVGVVHDCAGKSSGPYPGEFRALTQRLEVRGLEPRNWLDRSKAIHYAEGVLEQGALVSVGGNSVREIDQGGDSAGFRSPPERLVLRGTETQPLLIGYAADAR